MSGQISNDKALTYIFGGKSCATFINEATQNKYTYKVTKHKTDEVYFVSVLTGHENYEFIGYYKNDNFYHSLKSIFKSDAPSVKVFSYVLEHLKKETLLDIIKIYHDGTCGKCGKHLTQIVSVESGFGPECIKSLKNKRF